MQLIDRLDDNTFAAEYINQEIDRINEQLKDISEEQRMLSNIANAYRKGYEMFMENVENEQENQNAKYCGEWITIASQWLVSMNRTIHSIEALYTNYHLYTKSHHVGLAKYWARFNFGISNRLLKKYKTLNDKKSIDIVIKILYKDLDKYRHLSLASSYSELSSMQLAVKNAISKYIFVRTDVPQIN